MTEEEIDECRWQLQYRADHSARYHRRRSAFLRNLDIILTLIVVVSGASAFGDLLDGAPSWLSKASTATLTVISLSQVVLRLAHWSTMHEQWLRRWNKLTAEIELNPKPNREKLQEWLDEKFSIENECVGELRALALDCEDASARYFGIPNRQHGFGWLQRLLMHVGTFRSQFPIVPDDQMAPKNASSEKRATL